MFSFYQKCLWKYSLLVCAQLWIIFFLWKFSQKLLSFICFFYSGPYLVSSVIYAYGIKELVTSVYILVYYTSVLLDSLRINSICQLHCWKPVYCIILTRSIFQKCCLVVGMRVFSCCCFEVFFIIICLVLFVLRGCFSFFPQMFMFFQINIIKTIYH